MRVVFLLVCGLYTIIAFSQVEVRLLNSSFTSIEVPSKYLKLRIHKLENGEAICSIDVETLNDNFSFFTRRSLSYERCMEIIILGRTILNRNKKVMLVGRSSHKGSDGVYGSSWEFMLGQDQQCNAYFPGSCGQYLAEYPELSNGSIDIDKKLYP